MELKYLTSCAPALIKLKKCKFNDLKKSLTIMRFVKSIEEFLEFHNNEVNKIFSVYGEKGEDGNMHIHDKKIFEREYEKLQSYETNIEKSDIVISLEELEKGYPDNESSWFTIGELEHINDLFNIID